jgi:hypothetical protein
LGAGYLKGDSIKSDRNAVEGRRMLLAMMDAESQA